MGMDMAKMQDMKQESESQMEAVFYDGKMMSKDEAAKLQEQKEESTSELAKRIIHGSYMPGVDDKALFEKIEDLEKQLEVAQAALPKKGLIPVLKLRSMGNTYFTNYRDEFPDRDIVSISVIHMTEKQYAAIPGTVESARYFDQTD